MPAQRVSDLVPFAHVADVPRSILFYGLLGFGVRRTHDHRGEPVWAFLESTHGRLMVARASAPVDPEAQAVLFYLYTQDLSALREDLHARGLEPGEIHDGRPGPERQFRLTDPDGYCLMIAEIPGARV